MLYDILIIDDDFSGETVLDEMELKSKTDSVQSAWDNTIMPLYFELTKENLKVIWSAGESDDLEKLSKPQLSKVQYIICDLHLLGINTNANNKTITSKIIGILDELEDKFGDNKISFLINSKFINEHKNIKNDLQTAFDKKYPEKYFVEAFSEKNAITDEQKQKLLEISLISHIKEQIIKKHLELERCLSEKIKASDDVLEELSFCSKHKIAKKIVDLKGINSKIERFNEVRNFIAHHEITSLNDFNVNDRVTTKIKKFPDLFDYIQEIDKIILVVRNAKTLNLS